MREVIQHHYLDSDLSATLDASNVYTWTNSGNIDISSFVEGNVYVAFKYTSTSSASTDLGNW